MNEQWREETAWHLTFDPDRRAPSMTAYSDGSKTYWDPWHTRKVTDEDMLAMGYRKMHRKVTEWEEVE